jgi:hypothetical protein
MPIRLPDETAIGRSTPRSVDTVVQGYADPTGQAAQGLASGIKQLGQGAAQFVGAIASEQSDQDRFDVENKLIKLQKEQRRALEEDSAKLDGDPSGWAEKRRQAFRAEGEKLYESAPERLKPVIKNRLTTADEDLFTSASAIERGQKDRYFGKVTTDNLEELRSSVGKDPNRYGEIKKQGLEMIQSAPVSSALKQRMLDQWRSGSALAAADAEMQRDPEVFSYRVADGPAGSKIARGMQALSAWGPFGPAGILGNMRQESNFNPMARNPGDGRDGSDSIGVMQWNSDRATNLKAFAQQRGSDWRDYDTQLAFIDHELRTTEKGVGDRLKMARSAEEAGRIMIDYLRPAGWKSGDPSGAHGYDNRVGTARKIGASFGQAPAYAEEMSPEERKTYAARAERSYEAQIEEQKAATRAQTQALGRDVRDDLASIERTGQGLAEEKLSRQRIAGLQGEEAARTWGVDRARALRVHDASKGLETLPEEEMDARVARLEPKPGVEGFEKDVEAQRTLERRVERIRKARAQDPAMSVEGLQQVREARSQAVYEGEGEQRRISPASAQAIVKARLEAQQELGMQAPLAVTRAESRVIARELRAIGEDSPDRLDALMGKLRRTYGKYAEQVLNSTLQLQGVNKDLSAAAADVLARVAMGEVPSPDQMRRVKDRSEATVGDALMQGKPPPVTPDAALSTFMGFGAPMGEAQAEAPAKPAAPLAPKREMGATIDKADLEGLINGRISEFDFNLKYNAGDGVSASRKAFEEYRRRTGKDVAPKIAEPQAGPSALSIERDETGRAARLKDDRGVSLKIDRDANGRMQRLYLEGMGP